MPRTCTVCRSESVFEIDSALVAGIPQRAIAETYRASRSAIYRHASAHLPASARAASLRREETRYEHLVARMAALLDDGEQMLREARSSGSDRRVALTALREVRETLTALMKLTQPQISDSEVEILVRALGRVLPQHPTAAKALAEELDALGARDASQVIALAV